MHFYIFLCSREEEEARAKQLAEENARKQQRTYFVVCSNARTAHAQIYTHELTKARTKYSYALTHTRTHARTFAFMHAGAQARMHAHSLCACNNLEHT